MSWEGRRFPVCGEGQPVFCLARKHSQIQSTLQIQLTSQVQSDTIKYWQMQSDTIRYRQIQGKYSQIQAIGPSAPVYSERVSVELASKGEHKLDVVCTTVRNSDDQAIPLRWARTPICVLSAIAASMHKQHQCTIC